LVNMSHVFRKETEAEKGERACFMLAWITSIATLPELKRRWMR